MSDNIVGQKILDKVSDGTIVLTTVMHSGPTNSSFQIDQSASEILSVRSRNGGTNPTATLGSASTGLKTITISGGRSGLCDVLTKHAGGLASFQPPQSSSESG